MTKYNQYKLNLPDGMRDELKASAEKNNRSMNAEIIARIEASQQAKQPTLRDQFVMGVMSAFIYHDPEGDFETVATDAYKVADIVIAVRNVEANQ